MRTLAAVPALSVGPVVAVPAARAAGSLSVSAQRYSRRMMRTDYFGHLARIPVASRFTRIGVGRACGYHPGRRATMWVAHVGRR